MEPVEIDYSSFLNVLQDGRIWWPLADAIKLGAGYLPVRDDGRNLNPVLRAKNNRVLVNERTLFIEFSQNHYTDDQHQILVRDKCRYVEAHEFLDWLSRYLTTQAESAFVFPSDLGRAVRKATGAPKAPSSDTPRFESLTIALEDWFDRPLAELPEALRQRVEQEFFPMPWDHLSADRRRSVALQMDYQHDPATEEERKYWWDFFRRVDNLKEQIAQWEVVATPTAGELALRETRLTELRQELARMDTQKRQARGDYYPERKAPKGKDGEQMTEPAPAARYIAYPKAMHQLAVRLEATPEELAAWVWTWPKDGGIAAYMNANELDPPPRFFYATGGDSHDYIAPLMACWFRADDIEQFKPADRYLTGKTLIERWGARPGLHAAAFIQAKIVESRLLDIHPIFGGTRGAFSEDSDLPPLESGLFALSQIEKIETEDFDAVVECGEPATTLSQATDVKGKDGPSGANQVATVGPCAAFLTMENLVANELNIAFVGDQSESGLGANNMLEITARKETRRIALAELGLVDRRQGTLNSQGVILLGMAQKKKLTHSVKNAAKVKRLRDVFRQYFGVNGDPFERYRKGAGWVPHFKITDKRGAADERAKREAERRTDSYEELIERGDNFTAPGQSQEHFNDQDDAASAWLKDNDPDSPA